MSVGEIVPGKFRGFDNELGLTYLPNVNYVIFNEGFSLGNTNDFGYFDAMETKPSNEIRVALVGDSYVVGHELMRRNHFSTKLKAEIEKVTNKSVRIMNFGMVEYDFCDAYCRYENLSKKTNPDVVLWLAEEKDLNCVNNSGIPDLILKDEKLEIDYSFSKKKKFQQIKNRKGFLDKTRLWSLLSTSKKLVQKNRASKILFGKFNNFFDSDKTKKSDFEKTEPKIDPRIDNILEVLPNRTLLVITKEINFDIKEITKGYKGEIFFLDPEFDDLRAKGIDTHFWKGSNSRGHFNQASQKIMGERFSEELIIAMRRWKLI